MSLHLKENLVLTGLYIITENRASYRKLHRNNKDIEQILGSIKWIESTPKNVSRLIQSTVIDWKDERKWVLTYNWLAIKSCNFQEVTKLYLK